MRPTEHQRHPKQLHLMHQTQQAPEVTTRHPPTLLLAATNHPQPPRLVRDAQHLRRCRCHPFDDDAGRSGDDLGSEPAVGELEAEQVPGGGEEAGDVEQRVVGDAVAEQRAQRRDGGTLDYSTVCKYLYRYIIYYCTLGQPQYYE